MPPRYIIRITADWDIHLNTTLITTDRISEGGNAITSVRPSVRPLVSALFETA